MHRLRRLRRLRATVIGLALLALVVGTVVFLNPEPPALRTPLAGVPEAIDDRTGLYLDASGDRWLVAPALDGGLVRFPVEAWGKPVGVSAGELVDGTLQRVADQPYALRALVLEAPLHLEAWLFEPVGPAAAGIVILHGSGSSDRGNAWYVYLAHTLASAGHVVVLPDKRGSGRSDGDWRNEPLDTLAGDAAAWLERLRSERGDLDRFGFVGVSQGGTITPQAATLAVADFGVALSAAAVPLREQLRHELGNDLDASGAPAVLRPFLTWLFGVRVERRQPGFWRCNAHYDLVTHWQAWRGPLFLALGRDDELDNVPVAASLARLDAIDDADGLTWRAYDGVGHALVGADRRFAPAFRRDLLAWLDRYGVESAAPAARHRPAGAKGKQARPI